MQLTKETRHELFARMAAMPTPHDRVAHIAKLRRTPGRAWEVSILETIHDDLKKIEAARAPKPPTASPQPRYAIIVNFPDGWSAKKFAVRTGVTAGSLALGYYAIPAVGAIIGVVSTFAGYIIAAGFGFFFFVTCIKEAFRKSEKVQQSGGGVVYQQNMYINQNGPG